MAFINKKEEVIKLRLTQQGKNLLSRGLFRPECYTFFDDDIIYDVSYAGVSEHQNNSETRIKDSAIRDAQHLTVGIETRYDIDTDGFEILEGGKMEGEFDSLIYPTKEEEKDKILGFPLTSMALGVQEAPRFELKVFESKIQNPETLQYKNLDGARSRIPQLNFEPEYVLVKDMMSVNPNAAEGMLLDSESFEVNPMAERVQFLDGSFLKTTTENICILLEEFNVPNLSKNFEIEVFEVEQKDTENEILVPLQNWQNLFDIQFDSSVEKVPEKNKQRNNLF